MEKVGKAVGTRVRVVVDGQVEIGILKRDDGITIIRLDSGRHLVNGEWDQFSYTLRGKVYSRSCGGC